ncbi:MAG TPA: site-specific integrase [Pyrinomonadaceae bacterium]|nr:site-specific integrase [Pyrinomonadaceae bacterium]
MNIYDRDGTYWFRFMHNGRRFRKSTGIKVAAQTRKQRNQHQTDAEEIAAAYRTKMAKGEVGIEEPKRIPTLTQAMKDFLEWSEQEYATHPNTHRRYEISSAALLRYFGTKTLDRITSDDVERFKTWRAKQKKLPQGKKSKKARKSAKMLRPATVNRELACLKHVFTRNCELVARNPVKGVKFLEEDNEQTRVLTLEEEKLYLMAATQPLQDVATVMLETGMRPEEVYRIRRENVYLDQGYLFNPYGKTKAARRKIPLSEPALAVLARRMEKARGDYLFPGRAPAGEGKPKAERTDSDKPIVKLNAAHTATVTRCKVAPFRLYDLRHTWATRSAQAGVDLVTLAAMLGHSRIQMVLRYAHPTEEHQFAAMEKRLRYMAG